MNFQTALIALDMSYMDKKLIQTAYFASRHLGTERMYFVHAIPQMELSAELKKELARLYSGKGTVKDQIQEKLQEEIAHRFPVFSETQVTLLTEEGRPFVQLKNWLDEMQPDLLMVGKKDRTEHSGLTAIKLLRKAKCAVWFVAISPSVWINKVMVPLDYSTSSLHALQAAIEMKKQYNKVEITPCVVYDIPLLENLPTDYRQQIREKQIDFYQKKHEAFLNKNHINSDNLEAILFIENEEYSISKSLIKTADEEGTELIIMGAKGHSAIGSLILGSVTEKLVSQVNGIGVLVVR